MPPLDLDRLEALERAATPGALFLVEGRNAFPDLLRVARAAQALVTGVEREHLVPPPLLAALQAALEGRV